MFNFSLIFVLISVHFVLSIYFKGNKKIYISSKKTGKTSPIMGVSFFIFIFLHYCHLVATVESSNCFFAAAISVLQACQSPITKDGNGQAETPAAFSGSFYKHIVNKALTFDCELHQFL